MSLPRFCLSGLIVLLLLLVSACSSNAPKASAYRFNTLITEQGIKLFELSSPYRKRNFVLQPVANPYGEKEETEAINRRLAKQLSNQMELTGYCRKGYLVLGRHAGETTHTIRGECRERASEQDRRQFPNTIEQW